MGKYVNVAVLPTSGQMKVSPGQSEALQRVLFAYGYKWPVNASNVSNTHRNYIMWDNKAKCMTFGDSASPNFYLCYFAQYFETDIDAEECIGGIFSDWDTAHENYRKYAASTDAVRYQEKLAWLEENYNLIRK